jgi:hypothetical protein
MGSLSTPVHTPGEVLELGIEVMVGEILRLPLLPGARTEPCLGRSPDVYAMASGAAAVAGTDPACGSDGSVDPLAVGR